jgi:CheY-like chemotaxis protein
MPLVILSGSAVNLTGGDAAATVTAPAAGLRILVVDDNPDVAMAFSEVLSAEGYLVDIAETGGAALPLIETGVYAVVLADMRMPDLDGPALYREVVTRCPTLAKSLLFITSDSLGNDTKRFLSETGAVCLSKPCTLDEVESAIELVLCRGMAAPGSE